MLTLLSDESVDFPPVSQALAEPDGLLAVGGDLSTSRLLAAYRQGIFPWFSEDDPILWWSPSHRCIVQTEHYHPARTLRKLWNKHSFTITINQAFEQVMTACAEPTPSRPESWITAEMIRAYQQLHRLGHAHSIEIWQDEALVGGLYGIQMGGAFCGESMFHRISGASKVAFLALVHLMQQRHMPLLDCQLENPHLLSLGATTCKRGYFIQQLTDAIHQEQPSMASYSFG